MIGYQQYVDDFYINLHLNTEMELPDERETVLHFFEQMRKRYPDMKNFFARDNGDLILEGDKEVGHYRWIAIESHRLCSGHVNPETSDEAYKQHELLLEMAPPLLTLSQLDCEALDIMYGFDFNCDANHDEVVAEALGLGAGFEGVLDYPGSRLAKYEPMITLGLDDIGQLQCRLAVETRSTPSPGKTGTFSEDQLSVYFTVRQYWGRGPEQSFLEAFRKQRDIGEELLAERIIPRIIRPLAQAIASR